MTSERAGVVAWFTGLPSSGKSTLAQSVRERLTARGHPALVLDGDEVRAALVPSPGHDDTARASFYATLARLAALLARQGFVVLVAATAHRRAFREAARSAAPCFIEVHVDVAADECQRRDAKGLYALARRGLAPTLPGADARYEPPLAPEVVAHGGHDAEAVQAVVAKVLAAARSPLPALRPRPRASRRGAGHRGRLPR